MLATSFSRPRHIRGREVGPLPSPLDFPTTAVGQSKQVIAPLAGNTSRTAIPKILTTLDVVLNPMPLG